MKCLGLIGGIGWESTALYYRLINEEVRNRFGSLHSARLVVNSLEFQAIDSLVKGNRWNDAGLALAEAARMLERAGADAVVLCSNLMHYVVEPIAAAVQIPVLHIGDAVLAEARAARVNRLGLIGTRFTLEHDFLLERPAAQAGHRRLPMETLVPAPTAFDELDRIIYSELCRGIVREESREVLLRLAKDLRSRGAQAIVLGSSELALLLRADDFALPLFDSTEIHALAAVRWALGDDAGRRGAFAGTAASSPKGARENNRSRIRR
ncbi:MAG: amino acid racemase [Verrucomicrobia bacterium]|nr:amino acid racemase [Verrucomicrobiota bacterium]